MKTECSECKLVIMLQNTLKVQSEALKQQKNVILRLMANQLVLEALNLN